MMSHAFQESTALSDNAAPAADAVDFVIIGAQKSATTALFRYLTEHPNVYMPPEKEVEFFSSESAFTKGRQWYYTRYFAKAPPEAVKGEASTNYMMYSFVPERIYSLYPDVKLLASLRNPIDRAYSHYRMAVRRGVEQRPFHACVVDALRDGAVSDEAVDHNRGYVPFGEYARILRGYLKHFDRSRLLVLFSEEIASHPVATMRRVYTYLGVDHDFVPSNIDRKYHVGGAPRIPGLHKRMRRRIIRLQRSRFLGPVIRRVNFEPFLFWLETEMNVREEKQPPIEPRTRNLLRQHYLPDVQALESLLDIRVPWDEFHSCSDPSP